MDGWILLRSLVRRGIGTGRGTKPPYFTTTKNFEHGARPFNLTGEEVPFWRIAMWMLS